jgi:carboxypeptidase family protein
MNTEFLLRIARSEKRSIERLLGLLCCAFLATGLTFAQGTKGSIRGNVTDPQGAIVVGASVKLFDLAKNREIRTVQSDTEGVYQFLEVEPATYSIVITAAGFGETRFPEVRVEPNRNLLLDAVMTVGNQTAEVTVTAAQELVDRETPTLGTTVEQRRVVGLPLNGRNILDLALLQPGVTTNAAGTIRANGSRSVENNFQLDGSNNNETATGGSTGVQPRPDAVQEFRLLTSNFEAEFGRNSGTVINVVTRSGGNDFHCNVRAFFRPTVLSAARFFDQDSAADKPRPGTVNDFRRRYERKEFGGNIGGPIYLPRFGEGGKSLLSGKNRAFFFADYEGRRQLIGSTQTLSGLPSVEEKQGIFTRPANNPIFDPATGSPFPIISSSGANIRQQIPQSRFSKIGQYYLGFIPTSPSGQASVGADEVTNFDILTARVDPIATEKNNIAVTFNYFDREILSPFPFAGTTNGANVPGFGSLDLRTTYNVAVRHTYTISPTLINSFLAGYARNGQPSLAPVNKTTPAEIGFTADFIANKTYAGPPFIFLDDRLLRLGNTFQGPQARVAENFQIQDSVSWAKGDHRFKFGIDGTKYKQDQVFLFINQAIIGYGSAEEANTTGDDLADLIIGNSPGYIQFGANGERDYRQFGGAAFAQDTWRFTDQLTFSLGLRYEYVGPLWDLYNRVAYYRPSAAARGITSSLLTSGQLKTPDGVAIIVGAGNRAPAGLLYPGDPDPDLGGTVPAGGVNRDLNNFAPRFGFAYSPKASEHGFLRTLFGDQATVIRGGFGVFYGAIIGDTALQQLTAPGYQGTNAYFEEVGGTLADPFGPDPFPNYGTPDLLQPTIPNPFLASTLVVGVPQVTRALAPASPGPLSQLSRAISPFIRTPYTYQFNLTFERSFMRNYVAQLSYVGNRGHKLYALEQLNVAYGTPFLNYPSGIPAAQQFVASTANINARRVNTDFGLGISQAVSAGNSWYDSLQANLTRRYANGLLFQVAYTFSKSITDTAGTDTVRGTLDLFDRRAGRGLSADDVPHRFVGSFIYDLPFAKRVGNGFARTLLDGWSFGGIYTIESGKPFSVLNVTNITKTGGGVAGPFADFGTEPFHTLDPRTDNLLAFNPKAFANGTVTSCAPASFATCARRGTSGVNQFRLKNGINNFDLILSKRTKLWSESSSLELRFEAFNALNHTQFGPNDTSVAQGGTAPTGVNLNVTNASFGKFTSARESRVVQLGARFSF